MADDDVPGIDDVLRLGRWLQRSGITATETPPRVRLIAGGRSNLTYAVSSPAGGPTMVSMEVPCELSSPRT